MRVRVRAFVCVFLCACMRVFFSSFFFSFFSYFFKNNICVTLRLNRLPVFAVQRCYVLCAWLNAKTNVAYCCLICVDTKTSDGTRPIASEVQGSLQGKCVCVCVCARA